MKVQLWPRRWVRIGVAACSFMVAGCVSTSAPSRFFTLNSLAEGSDTAGRSPVRDQMSFGFQPQAPSQARSPEQAMVVAVGPLTIPDSVNRSEIVTADGAHQMTIHDFERWAGPLDKKVLRVLTDDLDTKLASDRFTVVVWNPSSQVNIEARYRVMVEVTRFELSREPGGAAHFDADWVLYGRQDKVLAMRQTHRRAPVTGTNVKVLVAAMSQCIMDFSGEVAETISSTPG